MIRPKALAMILISIAAATVTSAVGEQLDERPVDAQTRARVIDGVLKEVEAHYVFPDRTKAIVDALRANERAGQYSTVTSSYQLATTLSQNLESASHDKHLWVIYGKVEATPGDQEHRREFLQQTNFGFEKSEVLDGNIGYLDVHFFPPLHHDVTQAIAAAMRVVASTDALIIDMRQHRGGSPATVAAFASYFFDKPTLINRIYWREPKLTEEFRTTAETAGPKYGEAKPIFVLTSPSTGSGGEEFCYDLQARKRATVVGDVTWGGAHPTRGYQVTETFAVFVPVGRAVNPVTGTSWEGVGVTPDVRVPSDKALAEATRLAVESIAAKKYSARPFDLNGTTVMGRRYVGAVQAP